MFTLKDFVTESNRIEGLGPAQPDEIAAHELLLKTSPLTIEALEAFVKAIANAPLRRHTGMDVRVGNHRPPHGGARIVEDLKYLLERINDTTVSPWDAHIAYETLHPFLDGNGRSGRAIWLWQHGGMFRVPLGFLHTWYYMSLEESRIPTK